MILNLKPSNFDIITSIPMHTWATGLQDRTEDIIFLQEAIPGFPDFFHLF